MYEYGTIGGHSLIDSLCASRLGDELAYSCDLKSKNDTDFAGQ